MLTCGSRRYRPSVRTTFTVSPNDDTLLTFSRIMLTDRPDLAYSPRQFPQGVGCRPTGTGHAARSNQREERRKEMGMYDLRGGHNLVFRMYSYSGGETVSMSISVGPNYPLVAQRGVKSGGMPG